MLTEKQMLVVSVGGLVAALTAVLAMISISPLDPVEILERLKKLDVGGLDVEGLDSGDTTGLLGLMNIYGVYLDHALKPALMCFTIAIPTLSFVVIAIEWDLHNQPEPRFQRCFRWAYLLGTGATVAGYMGIFWHFSIWYGLAYFVLSMIGGHLLTHTK